MKQMLGLVVMLCLSTQALAQSSDWDGTWAGSWGGQTAAKIIISEGNVLEYRLQRTSSEGSWTDNHFRKHFNFRHTTRICDYVDETRPDYCCRALSWPIWRGRCGVGAAIAHGQIRHYQNLKGLAYNLNAD